MLFELAGIQTYFVMWGVAASVGILEALRLARHFHFPTSKILLALAVLAVSIVVGSKLLFLIDQSLVRKDDLALVVGGSPWSALLLGFRNPGGFLLFAAVLPVICRLLDLPTRTFGDAIIPAVGLVVVAFRLGCFLNGCCFGRVTDSVLGLTFPKESPAFVWQLFHGLVDMRSPRSLPVHPVQIYSMAFGLGLYCLGRVLQTAKRFDGQVLLIVLLAYFFGTFSLELFRAVPSTINMLTTAISGVIVVVCAQVASERLRTSQFSSPESA